MQYKESFIMEKVAEKTIKVDSDFTPRQAKNIFPFLKLLMEYLRPRERGFEGSISVYNLLSIREEGFDENGQFFISSNKTQFTVAQVRYRLRQLFRNGYFRKQNRCKYNSTTGRSERRLYYGIDYSKLDALYKLSFKLFVEGGNGLKPMTCLNKKKENNFVKSISPNLSTIYKVKKHLNEISQKNTNDLDANDLDMSISQQKFLEKAEQQEIPQAKNPQKAHDVIGVKWNFTGHWGKLVERESYSIKGFFNWCQHIGIIERLPYQSYQYFKKQLKNVGKGCLLGFVHFELSESKSNLEIPQNIIIDTENKNEKSRKEVIFPKVKQPEGYSLSRFVLRNYRYLKTHVNILKWILRSAYCPEISLSEITLMNINKGLPDGIHAGDDFQFKKDLSLSRFNELLGYLEHKEDVKALKERYQYEHTPDD